MNISGVDYLIITNIEPSVVLESFNEEIKSLWKNPIICVMDELNEFEYGSFFYTYIKDESMEKFFDENAYALNDENEGAFSLSCSMYDSISLKSKSVDFQNDENIINFSKFYNYNFLLVGTYMYTLILPSDTHKNFSKKIIRLLKKSIFFKPA